MWAGRNGRAVAALGIAISAFGAGGVAATVLPVSTGGPQEVSSTPMFEGEYRPFDLLARIRFNLLVIGSPEVLTRTDIGYAYPAGEFCIKVKLDDIETAFFGARFAIAEKIGKTRLVTARLQEMKPKLCASSLENRRAKLWVITKTKLDGLIEKKVVNWSAIKPTDSQSPPEHPEFEEQPLHEPPGSTPGPEMHEPTGPLASSGRGNTPSRSVMVLPSGGHCVAEEEKDVLDCLETIERFARNLNISSAKPSVFVTAAEKAKVERKIGEIRRYLTGVELEIAPDQ